VNKKSIDGVSHNENGNAYTIIIYYYNANGTILLYVLIVVALYPADGDDEKDGDDERGGDDDDLGTVAEEH